MKTELCIKLNNTASNNPCALCGKRTDLITGPELFIEGSLSLVCHECGNRLAPGLMRVLKAAQEMEIKEAAVGATASENPYAFEPWLSDSNFLSR